MRAFDHQLLRLKQVLGVTADGDVADALGMTKAAFSERKRRDAFPEDKLLALVARNPEMKLDAAYVLTGTSTATHAVLGSVRTASEIAALGSRSASGRAAIQQAVFEQLREGLPADEQLLLEAYRALDSQAKKRLLSQLISPTSTSSEAAQPGTNINQRNTGAGAVQVGHAGGKVTVKGRR